MWTRQMWNGDKVESGQDKCGTGEHHYGARKWNRNSVRIVITNESKNRTVRQYHRAGSVAPLQYIIDSQPTSAIICPVQVPTAIKHTYGEFQVTIKFYCVLWLYI
jgi:hypothetical protein